MQLHILLYHLHIVVYLNATKKQFKRVEALGRNMDAPGRVAPENRCLCTGVES